MRTTYTRGISVLEVFSMTNILCTVYSEVGLRLFPSSKGAILPGLDEGVLTMYLGELAEIKVRCTKCMIRFS